MVSCIICGEHQGGSLSSHLSLAHGLYGKRKQHWLQQIIDNTTENKVCVSPDEISSTKDIYCPRPIDRSDLDIGNVCDGNMLKLITCHAEAIGVPKEYIIIPLLTTVSGMLSNSTIKVNDDWKEKCSLWMSILGYEGSRRSSVLHRYMTSLQDTQVINNTVKIISETTPRNQLERITENISFKYIGLFEDFGTFMKLSEIQKDQVFASAYICQKFYDPGNLASFGVFGFTNEEAFKELPLEALSRILFVAPKCPTLLKSSNYKTPMPINTPCLKTLWNVIVTLQKNNVEYKLSDEARRAIYSFHDDTMKKTQTLPEGILKLSLLKLPGQVVRVACVLGILRQALKIVVYREDLEHSFFSEEISNEDVTAAKILVNQFWETKQSIFGSSENRDNKRTLEDMDESVSPGPSSTCTSTNLSERQENKRTRYADEHYEVAFSNYQTAPCLSLYQNPNDTDEKYYIHTEVQLLPESQGSPSTNSGSTANQTTSHCKTNKGQGTKPTVKDTPLRMYRGPRPPHVELSCDSADEYFAGLTHEEFWKRYAGRIKRLLEWRQDRVLPSTVAQRHLVPPLGRRTMEKLNTSTKYPVAMCKEYLHIVCELGFGTMQDNFTNNNTRRSIYFQKKPYKELTESARFILNQLNVSKGSYDVAFMNPGAEEMLESSDIVHVSQNPSIDMPVFPQPHVEQVLEANDSLNLHVSQNPNIELPVFPQPQIAYDPELPLKKEPM